LAGGLAACGDGEGLLPLGEEGEPAAGGLGVGSASEGEGTGGVKVGSSLCGCCWIIPAGAVVAYFCGVVVWVVGVGCIDRVGRGGIVALKAAMASRWYWLGAGAALLPLSVGCALRGGGTKGELHALGVGMVNVDTGGGGRGRCCGCRGCNSSVLELLEGLWIGAGAMGIACTVVTDAEGTLRRPKRVSGGKEMCHCCRDDDGMRTTKGSKRASW